MLCFIQEINHFLNLIEIIFHNKYERLYLHNLVIKSVRYIYRERHKQLHKSHSLNICSINICHVKYVYGVSFLKPVCGFL